LVEAALISSSAVKELVQSLGERSSAFGRADGIPQRHLLEREQQVRSRFDGHGLAGDLGELSTTQPVTERARA
jgi:hypothetical protein